MGIEQLIMSDQNIHNKIGDAAQNMHLSTNSRHLQQLQLQVRAPLTPRFCMGTRKDYRRALFQAALSGDLRTLDALAGQVEATSELIDEESCNNALWVAVAENHSHFAIALLQSPSMREKITLPGIKEAMKLSLEQKDKALINALLQFVATIEKDRLITDEPIESKFAG